MKSRKKEGILNYREAPPKFREFGLRLDRAIAESKLVTSYQLAKDCEINLPSIRDYIEGRSMPAADKLLKISKAIGVSIEYLLTGKEPHSGVINLETAKATHLVFPVEGLAAGGTPIENGYQEMDHVILHKAIKRKYGPGEYMAAWIKGDSMEPIIPNGSLVVIKKERVDLKRLDKNAIYCVNVPGEGGATVKKLRYREKANEVDLLPLNMTDHDPDTRKTRDVQVIGRVIGIAWMDL